MKKFLAILLLLTMCLGVLAACGKKNDKPADDTTADSVTDTTAGTTGEDDETTPSQGGDDEAATLEDAVAYLTSTYKSDEGKATPADYKLIAQIPIGETVFEVSWAVDNAEIKITLADGLYTVDVPAKNDTESTYTLTATVKDAAGKTAEKTFTRTLPVYDNSAAVGADDIKENTPYKLYLVQPGVGKTLFATTETQSDNKYIKTDVDPKKGADFYAEKVEGGYKFYTEINGVKNYVHAKTTTAEDGKVSKYIGYATESDCVYYFKADCNAWFVKIDNIEYVVGTYSSYETICISEGTYMTPDTTGVTQFPVLVMDKEKAEALDPTVPEIPADEEKSIVDFNAIASAQPDKGAATLGKYIVTGKITEIANAEYGNMYIEDDAGNKLYIYGLYDNTGDKRFDKMNPQPKVGDTVVVLGVACNYNGPQMKNAWVLKLNGENYVGSGSTDTPDTPAKTPDAISDLKAETAYKLFFNQVKAGKLLYIIGETDNDKYIKATTDPKAAVDVYAEAVEGGFKFYVTIDGAKKYIHAHTEAKDDGKVSKFLAYADSTDNVWIYKADINAWTVTVGGVEYAMGTYNTYETLSISESSYFTAENTGVSQFPGNFAAKADAEAMAPTTPDTPVTPSGDAILPETGKSYKLYFIQTNKNNTVYYLTGVLDGFYAATSENAAEGVDFIIETTDGGYYLSCTVGGAKKFVNIVEAIGTDGKTHINIKFDDAATSVWTIDETLKTVVTTLGDTKYIIGTRSDKTYTTLGPMAIDSGCMYAQFVLPGNTPSTPSTPSTPETPATPGASDIKVDTPYYISGINSTGAIYFDGTVTNGRINGKADQASAVTVKLEAGDAAGEYYIYFMNGDTKTYIAAPGSKTSAFDLITEKDETAVWLISTQDKGIVSKYMGTRGIGTQVASTYNNFSTYATSNFGTDAYDVSWFVEA